VFFDLLYLNRYFLDFCFYFLLLLRCCSIRQGQQPESFGGGDLSSAFFLENGRVDTVGLSFILTLVFLLIPRGATCGINLVQARRKPVRRRLRGEKSDDSSRCTAL
jgi:hypothetical protein